MTYDLIDLTQLLFLADLISMLSELGLEDGQELYVADPTSPNSLVFRLQISGAME